MRKLIDDLWVHEDRTKLGGANLLLRATIVKLASGGLWVHSPTPFSDGLRDQLAALGEVAVLVAPSNGHNAWYQAWCDAYPGAKRFVAPGIPKKLPKLTDFTLLEDAAPAEWAAEFEQALMPGTFFDECVFLHRGTKSLIVTDLVQNHRPEDQSGLGRIVSKLLLEPIGFKGICVAPPLKVGFIRKDKPAFRAFIDRVRGWEFERIVVTHGAIIAERPREKFSELVRRFDS